MESENDILIVVHICIVLFNFQISLTSIISIHVQKNLVRLHFRKIIQNENNDRKMRKNSFRRKIMIRTFEKVATKHEG